MSTLGKKQNSEFHSSASHQDVAFISNYLPQLFDRVLTKQSNPETRYLLEPVTSLSSTDSTLKTKELHYIGVDYKLSPIEVREKFSFRPSEVSEALTQFNKAIGPTVILSTCNRTELYISSSLSSSQIKQEACKLISALKGLNENLFCEHTIYLHSFEVVKHLFKVASGLESMILGEGQILNQVKASYSQASEFTDSVLNQLFQRALATGKRIRTETGISKGAMSVPSAALQIIQAKLAPKELSNQNIMILGSGQVAELCLEHLHSQGACQNITLVKRSESHSLQLTEYGVSQTINYSQLFDAVKLQDVILVCTSAPHYVIQPAHLLNLQKPLIVADMSMPRNVSPDLAFIPGIDLIDLDHLQLTVKQNQENRASEIAKADLLLKEELIKFQQWQTKRLDYQLAKSEAI